MESKRRFLPHNSVLEGLVEQHIMLLMIDSNPHLRDELYYGVRLVIHAIEVVDDDLLIAHTEHWLEFPGEPMGRPRFCQICLQTFFVDLALFNTTDEADNGDDDYLDDPESEHAHEVVVTDLDF